MVVSTTTTAATSASSHHVQLIVKAALGAFVNLQTALGSRISERVYLVATTGSERPTIYCCVNGRGRRLAKEVSQLQVARSRNSSRRAVIRLQVLAADRRELSDHLALPDRDFGW
jgi:hypothetical protein